MGRNKGCRWANCLHEREEFKKPGCAADESGFAVFINSNSFPRHVSSPISCNETVPVPLLVFSPTTRGTAHSISSVCKEASGYGGGKESLVKTLTKADMFNEVCHFLNSGMASDS